MFSLFEAIDRAELSQNVDAAHNGHDSSTAGFLGNLCNRSPGVTYHLLKSGDVQSVESGRAGSGCLCHVEAFLSRQSRPQCLSFSQTFV